MQVADTSGRGESMSVPTLEDRLQMIFEYRNLQKGWNSYHADPPNMVSRCNSMDFVKQCYDGGIVPMMVCPSPMGGVGIIIRSYNLEVGVEFYNAGTSYALFTNDNTQEEETCLVLPVEGSYINLLKKIKVFLNLPG